MKLTQTQLVVVGLLIVYIAFFTHPPAFSHIKDFFGIYLSVMSILLGYYCCAGAAYQSLIVRCVVQVLLTS